MSVYVDAEGTITFYQGDSGIITFTGLDKGTNYQVYFGIYDLTTSKPIVNELMKESKGQESITFELTAEYTGLIPVDVEAQKSTYGYGLKTCLNGVENTRIPGASVKNGKIIMNPAPKVNVYYKKVEGDI